MTRKKTAAAQLNREIATALARSRGTPKKRGKRVVDVAARSPDAEFILEGEEFDFPWTEETRPLAWFYFGSLGTLKDYARLPRNKDDLARMKAIEQWSQSHGGLAKALHESPILAWEDGKVLDGSHRLLVALQQGLRTVPVLVGHRPEGYKE